MNNGELIKVVQHTWVGEQPELVGTHEEADTRILHIVDLATTHSRNLVRCDDTDIWLKSTKSGPVGFEKIDFSHFSPCSMQWMFQTPGVSIVHVQKTVSYNTL